jgi:hypothetical protein
VTLTLPAGIRQWRPPYGIGGLNTKPTRKREIGRVQIGRPIEGKRRASRPESSRSMGTSELLRITIGEESRSSSSDPSREESVITRTVEAAGTLTSSPA